VLFILKYFKNKIIYKNENKKQTFIYEINKTLPKFLFFLWF